MNKFQIAIGILMFAVVTAVLYVWGLKKSYTKQQDLAKILLSKCSKKVLKALKSKETISKKEIESLIKGTRASVSWSKDRLEVTDPKKFSGQVIDFMVREMYIEKTDGENYRLR